MVHCCITKSLLTMLCICLFVIFQQAHYIYGAAIPEAGSTTLSDDCSFMIPTADKCSSFWGKDNTPPVIMVSMDGFRYDYLNRSKTDDSTKKAAPTLSCLIQTGVSTPYMMPSYPTITFPNHYSIVTGLYPESHQIVTNNFYDPDLNATFNIRKPDLLDPKWWKNGEPLWATVRKQGKVSASHSWAGSDVNFTAAEKRNPNYFFKYNGSIPFQSRVDQILAWMDLPIDQRPIFTTLYFDEPDTIGHKAGPNTPNVTRGVEINDGYVRNLVDGLVSRGIINCVNLIIVSDHGMADAPNGKLVVDVQKYVPDLDKKSNSFYGPNVLIGLTNSTTEGEKNLTDALTCKDSHMRVFNKWELPYRMHYALSNRIPNVVLDLDLTWRGIFVNDTSRGGDHGWDNLYKEMQAIFIARGPSFKKNTVVRPFQNIQIYNLVCALVNVTPAPNNGTWGGLHHLLINPPAVSDMNSNRDVQEMPPILHMPNSNMGDKSERRIATCGPIKNEALLNVFSQDFINLKTTPEREMELVLTHAPLGVPIGLSSDGSQTTNLLVNEDYVIGFDRELGMPVWTSYTISNLIKDRDSRVDGQWIQDPRLSADDRMEYCERIGSKSNSDEVHLHHLFPKEFTDRQVDAWLSTNVLEVPSYMTLLINKMNRLLMSASNSNKRLNVISGRTGRNLFYVVSTCLDPRKASIDTCPVDLRDYQAFLLPVKQNLNGACLSDENFITLNVATLKDIERVTGLNFFPRLPTNEKIDLLTRTILGSTLVVQAARS